MENKTILSYKDYVPCNIEDDAEFETVVLEDKKGVLFECKFRKPTTSEILRVKRENVYIKVFESDDVEKTPQVKGLEMENVAQEIFDHFDCIPSGLKVNMIKASSIVELVNTFCITD